MKIRYPGPGVPAERRGQDEYSPIHGLPLPAGVAIEVSAEVGEALCASGLTERVEDAPPAPAAAEPAEPAGDEPETDRPAKAGAKKR